MKDADQQYDCKGSLIIWGPQELGWPFRVFPNEVREERLVVPHSSVIGFRPPQKGITLGENVPRA